MNYQHFQYGTKFKKDQKMDDKERQDQGRQCSTQALHCMLVEFSFQLKLRRLVIKRKFITLINNHHSNSLLAFL